LSAIKPEGRPSFLFHGSRQIHLGHAICEDFRLGVIEIGQNDHREFVIRDLCFEALPRSFVFDDPVTVLGDDKPAKKARSLLGSRQIRHLIEHKLRGDPAHSLQHVARPRRISSLPPQFQQSLGKHSVLQFRVNAALQAFLRVSLRPSDSASSHP
jgi:hypothetical protein